MDQKFLKENLKYDPDTGIFTWLSSLGTASKGDVAGTETADGYKTIKIGGKTYRLHRLAFLYMLGVFPEKTVDHINGNRGDNRFSNLNDAGQSTNLRNSKISIRNKSGIVGVFWNKKENGWRSIVRRPCGKIMYKLSSSFLDACAWRKSKEIEFGYSINFGRPNRHV